MIFQSPLSYYHRQSSRKQDVQEEQIVNYNFIKLDIVYVIPSRRRRCLLNCPILLNNFEIDMKSNTLSEKLPFYQKVLNLTLGFGASPSRADDSASPFRRGYARTCRSPTAPTIVTPVKNSPSSTAASIFRSFRRRSLRRSFRRTKSFLVKNPQGTSHIRRTQRSLNSTSWEKKNHYL